MPVLRKIYEFSIDILQTLLLAAAVFLVIYVFLFRPFQVNGASMFPNFHDQEFVLTNLFEKFMTPLKTGDVIVFRAPEAQEKDFIKRVIGKPGDKVMVKNGSVYLNGKLLDESAYLSQTVKTYGGAFAHEDEEIIVPADHYLVMGDNRLNSSDSREWGFVKKDLLIGQSMFVYWPPSAARFIKNPYDN